MKSAFRIIAKTLLALLVIAAIASMALLISAQYWPDAASAVVSIGDTEIPIVGVFAAGAITLFVAWLAITLALLIGVLATVFALLVTVITLVLTAFLLALPFIASGLIVWLVMRRKQRASPPIHSAPNTLPPTSTV
jgi:hypothetical protein